MRTTTYDYVQLQCIQHSSLVRNKTNNQSIIVRSVADWRMPDTSGMSRSTWNSFLRSMGTGNHCSSALGRICSCGSSEFGFSWSACRRITLPSESSTRNVAVPDFLNILPVIHGGP